MAKAENQTKRRSIAAVKLPVYLRYASLAVISVLLVVVVISLLTGREPEFRMKSFPTNLSDEVTAVVEGYERKETEGDVVKYYIKADRATTFSDNHQELENVFLQVFTPDGQGSDTIKARKSVYIPEEDRDFTAYFAGDVEIVSRDGLKANTEQITYKKAANLAEAEEKVTFERTNVSGSSFGALVKIDEQRVELLRDVVISTAGQEGVVNGPTVSKTTAGFAAYDQANEKIEFRNSVDGTFTSNKNGGLETAVVRSQDANIFLTAGDSAQRDVTRIELSQNVFMDIARSGEPVTNIRSQYALYNKAEDRFDLRNEALIERNTNGVLSTVSGNAIVYQQAKAVATVEGNAKATQGSSSVSGNNITAEFLPDRKLKNAIVRGSAVLIQTTPERTTNIRASELHADFAATGAMQNAKAIGSPVAILIPSEASQYSKVTMSAPRTIDVVMKGEGMIDRMQTDGRTSIRLDVPNNSEDASNKIVIANTVRTFFHPDGKNLARAEAVGDAELHIEPLRAKAENYRSLTTAPRFDCEFFATGNNAKACIAGTKTKTVRTPTASIEGRGVQNITSDKLTAAFSDANNGIESLTAFGNAKFVELDRNATANSFVFTNNDGVVRLRGGEPTGWDSRARGRAVEIDWHTREQRSIFRGRVSSTYYSQRDAGNATPFSRSDRPVFITSETAEIDHRSQIAVYTGNARGWQEDNYIRAEKLTIKQREGRLFADGSVQSLLFQNKPGGGRDPINALARRMSYDRESRQIRYEESVDIRRGTDRLTGNVANVYLDEKNEVSRSEIDGNVVITQPDKRATGEFARYIAAEEMVYLRGNPATIDDAVNGASRGSEFTVYLKEKRVIGEGPNKTNTTGRIRSVYKMKNN